MSLAVMAAVWELDLPRQDKFVLLAFADIANEDGYCWPSIARIAWKCSYAEKRQVGAIVKRLMDSGVLKIVEPRQGRRAAMYQVRPWMAARLPDFDPANFISGRGAKNAPHADEADSKSLNGQEDSADEKTIGANNAPQDGRGGVSAPQADLEVQSLQRRGAKSRSVEVQKFPHEPVIEPIKNPRVRARERSRAPAPGPGEDAELFRLNNSARNLGIYPKTRSETIDDLRRRVEAAHKRKLDAQLDAQRAQRREAERREKIAADHAEGSP